MENEILKKRGLLLILMVASVVGFISLVWIIATRASRGSLASIRTTSTATIVRVEKNCVFPIAYWQIHPELFPSQIVLGSRLYNGDEIGTALSESNQDQGTQLQAQLIGAFLNILAGADQSLISPTIFQAYGWIVEHPAGGSISEADLQTGARLLSLLEAYNLGQAGVAACQGAATYTIGATVINTETSTVQPTAAPSETLTPTPSPSSTPTSEVIYPTWTVAVSTPTLKPTTEEPNGPPPASETVAPTVQPSNTPEPPTEEPAPTATDTPEPTLPPPP